MRRFFNNKLSIFVFAFPGLLIFTVFVVYPLFPELLISLQKHDGFRSHGFIGLANYKEVLVSPQFWRANKNTFLIVALSTFVALPISLMLAFLMDAQSPNIRRFFKATAVFPAVLSVTVMSQMWVAFYEPSWGLFNNILREIGLGQLTQQWLTDKHTALISVATAFLWQYVGLNTLLFYTGIKTIPNNYYEAAEIDGANFFQVRIKIVLPLLQDIIKYVLIISVLGSMALYGHVRIMTLGGPGDSSRTMVYQMYYMAFERSDFGIGSATALLFIVECLVVSFIINKYVAREKIEF